MAQAPTTQRKLRALAHVLWRFIGQYLFVVGLGAVAALGFEPLGLWPFTLLGVAGLVLLAGRAQQGWRAALVGWLWGVGHFTLGNNWIATAFTYQAKMPAALGALAVVLLALYLALFPALAAWSAWWARRNGWARALAFAGAWTISEWLRGWVLSGFAWNPLAVVALGGFTRPGLAALLPYMGTYALSGLVAGLAAVAALGAERWWASRRVADGAVAAAPFALMGAALLPVAGPTPAGPVAFTLVQPDIPQAQLNDPTQFESQFVKTARLTLPRNPGEPRLVLWPESGVPDFLRAGYPQEYYEATTFGGDPWLARRRIGWTIGPQARLLTGTIDLIMTGNEVTGARNVVTELDGQGQIMGSYAKAHLVPFGEYLPARAWLKPLGLERLVPGDMDFTPGPGPRTLDLGVLGKAGVQLCYEIVFSGEVVDRAHRPDYIFNPSNDGWFGDWGPPQHLAQARLRAIEEGLPVLRATTNGISAVIAPNGTVRQWAGRDVAARIDGHVPAPYAPTLFARAGNALALALSACLLIGAALVLRRRDG